ncbi:MAG TPA: cytochrome C oxidase subunit IV family protein [Polyangiaceae bacterium]|jgi:cytochrome c oxidase subunit 4|nr:cytochrome C oxidase subunit IV family protein [Polyangiaceae bacterium]
MSSTTHVLPLRVYFAIFFALLVLTGTTVAVAFVDLGPLNNVVALGIAACKATLVILYFMHVRYATRLTSLVIVSGVFWLAIMVGLTLADYATRGWLGVPGR